MTLGGKPGSSCMVAAKATTPTARLQCCPLLHMDLLNRAFAWQYILQT